MTELKRIHLDNGVFEIHVYRKSDVLRIEKVIDDLFEILNNKDNVKFVSEKYVADKKVVANQLFGVVIGYSNKSTYTHFITYKESQKIIGEVILITPERVEESYKIKNTWMIEFLLNKHFWGKGIMSNALSAIVANMKEQGVKAIGALCNRENLASIRVLTKVGFRYVQKFDDLQDYYSL